MTFNNLLTTHNKLLVIVGPTASGKSELAVKLAKRFNGEIISCDSRQIYKGMDLGTGKVTGKWKILPFSRHLERSAPEVEGSLKSKKKIFTYKSIPHHCIDFVSPKQQYSVAKFKELANKAIFDIQKRGKLPILCGGTAHWVDSVVYNQTIPEVKPNLKLRANLEKKSAEELFNQLKKLDPIRASNIDKHNKRRLIRALEIVITTGEPVPVNSNQQTAGSYKTLLMGIKTNQKSLYQKIDLRLKQRLKQGMVTEVKKLKSSRLSWKRLESFGLEYKFVSLFLQNKLTKQEMFIQLSYAIKHYSKRQLTWWKRNKNIVWIKPEINIANKLIINFLKNA